MCIKSFRAKGQMHGVRVRGLLIVNDPSAAFSALFFHTPNANWPAMETIYLAQLYYWHSPTERPKHLNKKKKG